MMNFKQLNDHSNTIEAQRDWERNRVIVTAAIIFFFVFISRYWIIDGFGIQDPTRGGDFGGALMIARNIVNLRNPYTDLPNIFFSVPYPLTAGVFALPFVVFNDHLASTLFLSVSVALMATVIVQRTGQPWRLMMLFSAPFIAVLKFAQWSPLIVAAWYIPILAPLMAVIKPQIALPVAINRMSKIGILIAGCLVLISLVIYPAWPVCWLKLSGDYEYFIPILLSGGFLLALSVLKWRHERARLLAGMAVLPARGAYDLLVLFIIPENIWQMAILVITTWLAPPNIWYLVALGCVLK